MNKIKKLRRQEKNLNLKDLREQRKKFNLNKG